MQKPVCLNVVCFAKALPGLKTQQCEISRVRNEFVLDILRRQAIIVRASFRAKICNYPNVVGASQHHCACIDEPYHDGVDE